VRVFRVIRLSASDPVPSGHRRGWQRPVRLELPPSGHDESVRSGRCSADAADGCATGESPDESARRPVASVALERRLPRASHCRSGCGEAGHRVQSRVADEAHTVSRCSLA
jgi:hypothetical protein